MAKKRGDHEGTIFKRGNVWKGSIRLGNDANGQPVRKWVTGKTRREVQEKLDDHREQKRGGFVPTSAVVTVEDVVRRYLKSIRDNIEPNTYAGYLCRAETHVIPRLGHLPIEALQAEHVDEMLDAMREKGLQPNSLVKALGVLSRALKMAVKKRQLRYNVCDWVETPRIQRKEKQTLSTDELQTFFKALSTERMRALFIVMAQTGIRVSECLGLWWDAVDLDAGEIVIRRSLVDAGKEYYVKPYGKTKSSARRIKLTAIAEQELIEHRARMAQEGHKSQWVFCNADGNHLKRRSVLQWHKRILKNAGLPVMPLKNLRHTVATILLGRKWPLKTVADLLGHSNIATTADFYGQFTEGIHGDAIADLGLVSKPNETVQS